MAEENDKDIEASEPRGSVPDLLTAFSSELIETDSEADVVDLPEHEKEEVACG